MRAVDILKKWLEYAEYDPEQRTHNLLSVKYDYHRVCANISSFLGYDPTGEIAVMYAKHRFASILKDSKVNAFDVVADPDCLKDEMEMWRTFNSPDFVAIENTVLDRFDDLLRQVVPTQMLGNRDMEAERDALFGSIEAVVDALHKCNVDLFLRGGDIGRIHHFSTHIHVFNQLAECLLAIEKAADGIYLCYISAGGSVDGYFGFFLKSNGTILSINERINESYPGEHKNHRNNRYAENKKYQLFPYNYIFSFEGSDYKGYATQHIIDEEQLAFFKLTPKAYLPLVIAMVLLSNRYAECDLSAMEQKYVDSLLPVNLALPCPSTQALTVTGDSQLAAVNKAFSVPVNEQDICTGTYNHLLCRPRSKKEADESQFYDYKWMEENLFIQLYADGFQLDSDALLESNRHLKRLPAAQLATTKETPNAEFVGTKERLTAIAYMDGREQLAQYIRERMFEEYMSIGGTPFIDKWWQKTIQDNKQQIFQLCVQRYQQSETRRSDAPVGKNNIDVFMYLDQKHVPESFRICRFFPFNERPFTRSGSIDYSNVLCPITGQKASQYFSFSIDDWMQISEIAGMEDIPKILKGYKRCGHRGYGNSILNATDPMTELGTPFEEEEIRKNRRLWDKATWSSYYFHRWHAISHEPGKTWDDMVPEDALPWKAEMSFSFSVGFSKRGLNQLLKESIGHAGEHG